MRNGAVPVSRKIAIACKVVQRTNSAVAIGNHYGLSKRVVFKYVSSLLNHRAMKDDRGRPRVFDEVSVEALRRFFETQQRPDWAAVKVELLNEQRKTWCRLHHAPMESISDTNGPKKMSKRSICRYLNMFNYQRN